jgi:hypothetical protein
LSPHLNLAREGLNCRMNYRFGRTKYYLWGINLRIQQWYFETVLFPSFCLPTLNQYSFLPQVSMYCIRIINELPWANINHALIEIRNFFPMKVNFVSGIWYDTLLLCKVRIGRCLEVAGHCLQTHICVGSAFHPETLNLMSLPKCISLLHLS